MAVQCIRKLMCLLNCPSSTRYATHEHCAIHLTLRMLWYYSIPARSGCNRISQASSLVKGMKSVTIAIILEVVLHNLVCNTG